VTKPTTPYDSVREWARYWLGGGDDTAVSNHGTLRNSLMYEVMVPATEDDLPPFQLPDSSPVQIAADLRLSEVTVKVHRASAMRKMHATSLAHLIKMLEHFDTATVPGRQTQ
jgi:regulatory LuxR family protein